MKLSKLEAKIEQDLEQDLYRPVPRAKEQELLEAVRRHVAARNIGRKGARINIRLRLDDLERIKEHAERDGLAYQSLIASILHRFVNGTLVDVDAVRAAGRPRKTVARSRKSA